MTVLKTRKINGDEQDIQDKTLMNFENTMIFILIILIIPVK